jgi:hypothetical protein
MRSRWFLPVLLLSLALESCGLSQPAGQDLARSDPQAPPPEQPSSSTPENPIQLGNIPDAIEMPANPPPVEKFVSLSKKDLAERLQIDTEEILLVKNAEMLWLNAALGCPRPGKVYPTGRVPGFQIWLEVEGTQYIYNTDFNDSVILCPELNPHIPNSDTGPTPGVPIR